MRNLNLDPFWRTSIGFDRLFDLVDESLRFEPEDHYPPCNITRTGEDSYRISLAVAGFKPDQIAVTVNQNTLIVSGRAEEKQDKGEYLYRGIAGRSFERRFSLADYVVVKDASLDDGLLQIELERELPEAMKPRRIDIKTGKAVGQRQARTIEHSRSLERFRTKRVPVRVKKARQRKKLEPALIPSKPERLWRQTCPSQSRWFAQHRTTFLKDVEEWPWSIRPGS